jgi:hypothetical protein
MKELNEYKSEIFRRSAEKKRQIKKRRRIALSVGIPLCLCCVIAVATLPNFPRLAMKGKVAMDAAPECESPMASEALLMAVQWQDLELWISDPEIAAHWEQLLTDWPADVGNQESFDSALADMVTPEDYVITLYQNGEPQRYLVIGDRLYRESTGQSRKLTAEELSQLEALVNQ